MKTTGLPAELEDLLKRLQRRGIPITPPEVARLRHLLGVGGEIHADELGVLLSVVLCKEARHRTLFQREYRRWQTDFDRTLQSDSNPSGDLLKGETPDAIVGMEPGRLGLGILDMLRQGATNGSRWRRGVIAVRRYRRYLAAIGVVLVLAAAVWIALSRQPIKPPPPSPLPPPDTEGLVESASPTASLCPQDLPTEAVAEVWAWVPRPDHRPWLAAGGSLFVLLVTLGGAWSAPIGATCGRAAWHQPVTVPHVAACHGCRYLAICCSIRRRAARWSGRSAATSARSHPASWMPRRL